MSETQIVLEMADGSKEWIGPVHNVTLRGDTLTISHSEGDYEFAYSRIIRITFEEVHRPGTTHKEDK